MIETINLAQRDGDTLGGTFTVIADGVPVGLGSHAQWDRKIDASIARQLMSIQAIKGVEFGLGFCFASRAGSAAHDEIFYSAKEGYYRATNNAGGIEGGMTNGQPVVVSCVMKPIPSLRRPLRSVNIRTRKPVIAEAVRSDVCAVPAAAVVGEAAVAFEVANACTEKFGGDSMHEMTNNFKSYIVQARNYRP